MFRKFREGREKRREEQEKQRQEQEKQRLEEERTKWLTAPIEERTFVSFDNPHPSFEELANLAIQRAGSDAEYDPDAVPLYFVGLWLILAAKVMKGYAETSDAVHGLWMIPQRDDFEYRMLWDYLTMHGATGLGIHGFLAKEMQSIGYIEEVAKAIRRGDVRDAEAVSRSLRP